MARWGTFAWVLVATVSTISLCGCSHTKQPRENAAASRAGELLDLDGNAVDLPERQKGRVTAVVFTRTECPVANRFAPEIRSLCAEYGSRGVDFFLIYVDPRETPQAIRDHARDFRLPCPALRDPTHAFVARCGATITPEAVLFDKSGAVVYQGRINDQYLALGTPRPAPTRHDLAEALESTVLGRAVATPRTQAVGCIIADLKD